MFEKDFHIHTSFSSDSKASPEIMIESAIEKGLKEICITDHYDFYYPNHDFTMNIPAYQKKIGELTNKYCDKIIIHCGIEIGMDMMYKKEIHQLLNQYKFDFIIGSVHVINHTEFYYGDFFENKTKEEAHRIYLENVLWCVREFQEINVLGHFDYIIRYGQKYYEDFNHMDYEKHKDLIEDIFKELIKTNRGIEINTSGYKYGMNCTYPEESLVMLYKNLGGIYITTGSDAHCPEHVAQGFEELRRMLK